jgi:hypothetical protein
MRVPRKLKKKIPNGMYCYTGIGWKGNYYLVKPCPLFNRANNGEWYCKLFNKATDNVEWDILLSDQCKVCGIKNNWK